MIKDKKLLEVDGSLPKKEKPYGQKQQTKDRLVAHRFKEFLKPQSVSPTASKANFKLLMAVAANNGSTLASIDIRSAFL